MFFLIYPLRVSWLYRSLIWFTSCIGLKILLSSPNACRSLNPYSGFQDEQSSWGILLCNHNSLLFLALYCFSHFTDSSAMFKRDVSYILGSFFRCSALGSVFLQNLVNHMTRNGNPSFSLLHISIRNVPLCSAETFLFKVTHDIHLPNLIFILLGSHCSTSATFDSLISFFLREVFFFFFFNFPFTHYVFKSPL